MKVMEEIAYYIGGRVRREVIHALKEKPKTAVMLSDELNRSRPSISRILLELEQKGYAKCVNPEKDKFRLYSLTGKGLKLLEKAEKYNKS